MQPFGSFELGLAIGVIAVVLLAIAAYAGRSRHVSARVEAQGVGENIADDAALPAGAAGDGSEADAAALRRSSSPRLARMSSPRLAPDDERPTEDDIARAHLGGTRGSPDLPDAPMTPQRAKKTPAIIPRGGHTA